MNKQLRDEWVKALRSGEYKQGIGHLQIGHRFCCLGVLCVVSEKIGFSKVRRFDNSDPDLAGQVQGMYLRNQEKLCDEVSEEVETKLANMNDSDDDPKSFHQLATWIEQNVPVDEDQQLAGKV